MSTINALDIRYLAHNALALPDGGELYYELQGDGQAVTFLNNFYILSPVWRNFTGDLADRMTMLTYDLRNQGASHGGDAPFTFATHADDLLRLLDHAKIESTVLVGTSISTLIARDFAVRHPDRVSGLVLVGPAFSPFGGFRRQLISKSWLASLEAGGTTQLFDALYPLVFSDQTVNSGGKAAYFGLRDTFLALLSEASIRQNLVASMDVVDNPDDLAGLTMPVQIMLGDGEFMWSESMVSELQKLIPHASVATLPAAGHVPFFDAPEAFQDALGEFLDVVASGGGQGVSR